MNHRILLSALLLAPIATACGDDEPMDTPDAGMSQDTGTPDMGTPDTGTDAGMNEAPPPPTLGTMIDRVGRPGITTALVAVLQEEGPRGQARDAYNAAAPAEWSGYASEIAGNLAVYDSLDTVCGNQVLSGPAAEAGRYATLGGALADDRLFVRTGAGSCGQYLAVELDATGVAANMDCGGRAPSYDVIDVTYSALAIGAVEGVSDGVDADDATHSDTVFPFLAEP